MAWAGTVATSHTGYSSTTATYAGPVPGTIVEGDLILAQLVSATSTADSITMPDGTWTELVGGSGSYSVVSSIGYYWAWHQVTAAEAASPPSSWDFTLGTARAGSIMITRVTGHDTSSPFDTSVQTAAGSASDSSPLNVTGSTSTVDDALLIGGAVVNSATSRTITEPVVPGAWTEDDTSCGQGYGKGQDAAHYGLGTAGATGTIPWYISGNTLAVAAWHVVVAPAPPATSAPPLHQLARNRNQIWRIHR